MGGDSGKSGGCLAPDGGEDARSRSRSFCCCLRTACDIAGFVRLCFFFFFSLFSRLQTAFLAPSLQPRLSSFPLPSLASPSFPSPVLLGHSGRRGGRLPFRSPRWLPSTGLGPLDSPPPSRDFGGEMQANSSWLFIYFFPFINPDEVFLSEPRSS